jgi:methanogen homoaconitase small subunit
MEYSMSIIWKFGNDVDTDQIVPGRYAPYMRPDMNVSQAAFIEARPDFNQYAAAGDIIVAGDNFGCGSSREYAVEALVKRGIAAIFARSFARIFFRNSLNLGLPLFESLEISDFAQDREEFQADWNAHTLLIRDNSFVIPELPAFARAILAENGIVPYLVRYGKFPGEA